MLKRIMVVVAAVLVLLLSGCASNSKMAFSNDTDVISKTGKPIFLMSVTLKNSYKNSQPKLSVVTVDRAVQVDGNPGYDFGIDDKAKMKLIQRRPAIVIYCVWSWKMVNMLYGV